MIRPLIEARHLYSKIKLNLHTITNVKETLVLQNMTDGLFLFVADWAGEPCTSAHQIVSASTSKHAVPFAVVNEDSDSAGLFDLMRVEVVPSLLAVRDGKVFGRVEGVDSKGIILLVEKYKDAKNIKIFNK